MTPQEAERILQAYSTALGSGANGGIARNLSALPCSKSRIRYAYYVYLTYLTGHGDQYQDLIQKLMVTYAALPQFIPDKEARTINDIFEKKRTQSDISDDEAKMYSEFQSRAFDASQMMEIDAFVHECFILKAKQN